MGSGVRSFIHPPSWARHRSGFDSFLIFFLTLHPWAAPFTSLSPASAPVKHLWFLAFSLLGRVSLKTGAFRVSLKTALKEIQVPGWAKGGALATQEAERRCGRDEGPQWACLQPLAVPLWPSHDPRTSPKRSSRRPALPALVGQPPLPALTATGGGGSKQPPCALWLGDREGLGWAQFAEWCNGNTHGLCVQAWGPQACDRRGSGCLGPLLRGWLGVGMLWLRLHVLQQIDKVQGLCSASQGTRLMADQWGAGGLGRVCWEQ